MRVVILVGSCIAWSLVSIYGLYNAWLAIQAWRAARRHLPRPAPPEAWPFVTVQVPVYNEPNLQPLFDAVLALRYPRDRIEIQLLDDSDASHAQRNADALAGTPIVHVRRPHRSGYKAQALAEGMRVARGDLFLLLDADFTPHPDLLERLVPWFNDARVGMVQARWDNAPTRDSILERCAAYWIDRHFNVDQLARSRTGHFFHFNGSAGMWRRNAIEDAGGWRPDTITEDMDLSLRAWKRGWRFIYDHDVCVPARIPPTPAALRIQQRRWSCGVFQVVRKVRAQVDAPTFLHLTGYCFPMLLCALALGAGLLSGHASAFTTLPMALFCGYMALRTLACFATGGWRCAKLELEAAAMGIGLAPILVVGAWAAFGATPQVFHRTPKEARVTGRQHHDGVAWIELALAGCCAASAGMALRNGAWCMAPLPLLAAWGLGVMGSSIKGTVLAR